jgi:hypothetical protein
LLPRSKKNYKSARFRKRPLQPKPLKFEVQGAFFLQQFHVAEDVLLDFLGLGFGVKLLQIGDDLRNGVLTVAALDNFKARTIEAKRALRHEQNFLVVAFSEAAARRESRAIA